MAKNLIPAVKFKKKARCNTEIYDYVNDILKTVHTELEDALSNRGIGKVILELPTNFETATLTNAEAQRLVYFYTLKTLEDAKYIPTMIFSGARAENQKVSLQVEWMTAEDKQLQNYMDHYIAAKTINNSKPVARRHHAIKK